MLLGALAAVVLVATLVYGIAQLSLYNCGGGIMCGSLPDIAVIAPALVPLVAQLYSSRPTSRPQSELE